MAVISRIFTQKKAIGMRLMGAMITLLLRGMKCKVGKNLRAEGWPFFKVYPYGNIHIGDHLTLGKGVTFEIPKEGLLKIEDHVSLGDRVVLSTITQIKLGNWVSIAENTGIRGSFHQLAIGKLALMQPSDSLPIVIDEGVGIGANSTILLGVHLPEGVIVGANSVVHKSIKYERHGIYAGNPARLLRFRN